MNVFSEVREGLRISWGAIRSNKLRSGLTTLGIVIGILTVSLMATAIQGLNQKGEGLQNELHLRDAQNAELKRRLEAIEKILQKQA